MPNAEPRDDTPSPATTLVVADGSTRTVYEGRVVDAQGHEVAGADDVAGAGVRSHVASNVVDLSRPHAHEARAGVRTVSELHDRVLAAAEQTLARYLELLSRPEPVDSLVLPSALKSLVETTLKLQAGADTEVTPRTADLERKRTEAERIKQALAKKHAS